MSFRHHSERPNRNRVVHLLHHNGLTTLCEKDPARVMWTDELAKVTCAGCLKAKGEALVAS